MPVARTMVTRGVLVDVAAHRGVPALEPDAEVTVSDLEATLDAQRVSVFLEGDALLVRTGHLGRIRAWRVTGRALPRSTRSRPREPGVGAAALGWLHEHGICAIAWYNWAVEWLTGPDVIRMPVHEVGIVHMGLLLGEMFELDELAPGVRGRQPL